MKTSVYLIVFLGLFSCQENRNTNTNEKVESEVAEHDTLLKTENDTAHKAITSGANATTALDSFLLNPFDLYAFKSKKKGSLSGGANFKSHHYKPDFPGIGYRFFMFEPKTVNRVYDGREMRHQAAGYLGADKNRISMQENGLVIRTFQPNDRFKHQFLNPNEIMFELVARHNDFDLPEMAFVGLDSSSIIKRLGKESFYKKNCLVYTWDNRAFILKIERSKVAWIRYIRLATNLTAKTENSHLYKLD